LERLGVVKIGRQDAKYAKYAEGDAKKTGKIGGRLRQPGARCAGCAYTKRMAVFTEVPFAEAAALLLQLGAGTLQRLEGIGAGIENTNYFADTSEARLVVTLFERLGRSELPFYLELMRHLAERGLPVPKPLAAVSGELHGSSEESNREPRSRGVARADTARDSTLPVSVLLHTLAGKPAAVTPRLPGAPLRDPSGAQCARVAATLAKLHHTGRDYPRQQPNPRGLSFWREHAPWLAPQLAAPARALLESELAHQETLAASAAYAALPRGAVHGDLFRDNVLFDGDTLSGLLDFYFAATDTFLYDIAVCLNDWCTNQDGALVHERATAFVAAYDAVRTLHADELALLPMLLRAAALRFWISRLVDTYKPRDASLLQPKDAAEYERILRLRIAQPWQPR
jgi:homoserine kinase type II